MATPRGKQGTGRGGAESGGRGRQTGNKTAAQDDPRDELEPEGGAKPIPDLMRRAIALGLSGFFTTEEAVRKALGDTVPKDWTDFLVDTSDRTRAEFLDRLSHEIGRVLEGIDFGAVLRSLLEGRTLEVKAEFRLGERGQAEVHFPLEPGDRPKSRYDEHGGDD